MSIIDVPVNEPDGFRNKLYNIDTEGKRSKIYPHKPDGRFYKARTIVSWFLLLFLFGAPFVKIHGHQFMLFNILERKFVLFGVVFFPQDLYIVVLGILVLLVSIFLFTAVLGRIWCGWLCPQTVFLEMLFRKIEYAIEGNAVQQRNLDNSPKSPKKFLRKALKHGIFYAISFAIGNTFLAYIIGSDELINIVTSPPTQHLLGFTAMLFFSLVFYGVFARFREQACIVVCPYGRYQSALVDQNTVLITYDFKRGEPRGKFTKADKEAQQSGGAASSRGDCIDCHQCVNVCPTGIDIRNGIQLECVNCAACIDACDTIMDKVKKPRGLIRYTSITAVREGHNKLFTTRVKSYIAVWALISAVFLYFFLSRPMTEVLILRQPGTLSQTTAQGDKLNFYVMNIINKHYYNVPVEVKVMEPSVGKVTILGDISNVPEVSEKSVRFMLTIPKEQINTSDMPVKFGVYSNGELLKEISTRFLAADLGKH